MPPAKGSTKRKGTARWKKEDTDLAYKYFNGKGKKKINFSKLQRSADYCKEIQDLEELWQRHPNKNFYNQIRVHAQKWLAEQQIRNRRRGADLSESDGNEEDEKMSDVESEADDDEDRKSFTFPRLHSHSH